MQVFALCLTPKQEQLGSDHKSFHQVGQIQLGTVLVSLQEPFKLVES